MKRLCAKEALKLVPDHGTIGLGGGETISYLCEYIKEAGKDVEAVTPSDQTKKVCKQLGITVIDTNDAKEVKIAFDGCDEVDQNLNAYKSGGGIHTKEKIIAKMAQEYVLLVDETKVVEELDCKVPVVLEVVPEAASYVTGRSTETWSQSKERDEKLLELYFEEIKDLRQLDQDLKQITGVIETSLFYQVASKAVVAGTDGIRIMQR
ncbi:MAG: ribose 5-phosphate isomerase A [Anaerostipes sp.]